MTEEEKLLDIAEREYYYRHDRMLVMQNDLFKTYLWSASLALTLDGLLLQHLPGPLLSISRGIAAFSGFVALGVIILCLDGLRGRGARQFPTLPGYLEQLKQFNRPMVMEQMIGDFWDNSRAELTRQEQRTVKLRASSRALIFSFILLAMSVAFFIPQTLHVKGGEHRMVEENRGGEAPPPPGRPAPSNGSEYSERTGTTISIPTTPEPPKK